MLRHLVILLIIGLTTVYSKQYENFLSDEFIEEINSKQTSWRAGRNFHPDDTDYASRLLGFLPEPNLKILPVKTFSEDEMVDLPKTFDSRKKWPDCPTINDIRDQGSCGSCWAFAAVEAMSDRYCIHSNATKHFFFSAQDLMSCDTKLSSGCKGGYHQFAWQYWVERGIVSGGGYNSSQGCRPYELPPCEHHMVGERKNCTKYVSDTPKCSLKCREGYTDSYKSDKRFGKISYSLSDNETEIMSEIYDNGPVSAGFMVYTDFYHYKTGVYYHVAGDFRGFHIVKIIGWGEEGGKKFWLIANSWNSDWGDNGFFKILRGGNHCDIESGIAAGTPEVTDV